MQNNFSKCREWVPRGTSQHKWRWLTTLLLILTLGIGQMWADTYADVYTNPASGSGLAGNANGKGAFSAITCGTGTSFGNSSLQINTSGGSGTFTVASIDGSYITSIAFTSQSSYPINSLTSEQGTITIDGDVYTFTPTSATLTSATFSMSAKSSKKVRVAPITVNLTSDHSYLSMNFGVSSGTVSCTKSSGAADLVVTTTGSASSNRLSFGSGKTLTFTSEDHNISSINFTFVNHAAGSGITASTGTFAGTSWTPDEDVKTVTFSSSSSNTIGAISVKLAAATPPANYTVTLNPNGGSYAPTPDGWTLSEGVYTKSVAAGSFTPPTGLTNSTKDLTWKDNHGTDITFPITLAKDSTFVAQWADHAASSDAKLSALSVAGCTFNETFDPATLAYTVDLPFYASMPATSAVTATKNDANAEDPEVSVSGNVITVHCVAEDGTTEKDYTITVNIAATPTASSSINIEQLVLDNGKSYDIVSALTAANIVTDGRNGLDSLNDVGKTNRNYAYLGLKLKKANADIIKIVVPAEKALNVKFGNVGVALTTTINGVAGSNVAKKTDGYSSTFHLDAAAVVREVVFHSSENQTVTLQQVKIDADVDAITLPWLVTYDAGEHGTCATVKQTWTGSALTLPSVTPESGWSFDGWNDGSADHTAGEFYTPTTNVTMTAQYSALASPFDLTALTYQIGTAAAVNVGYADGTYTYNIELPYKPSYDAITVAPTLKVGTSYLKGDEVLTVSSLPGAATFTVVEDGGASEKLYTVNFTKAAKDPISIIETKVTSQNNHGPVGGLIGGDAAVANASNYKLNTGNYVGLTLAGSNKFQAGDIVVIRVTNVENATGFTLYTTNDADSALIIDTRGASVVSTGLHYITLPETYPDGITPYAGTPSVYLLRANNSTTGNMNPRVDSIAVLRAMNPVLKAIRFNSTDVAVTSTSVSATLPNGTNLASMTVTPTVAWNGAGTTVVTSNEGVWKWGENTYVVTDKDGDATTYTITLTEEVLKHSVSFNTHGGSVVDPVEVVDGESLTAAPADPTKDENVFKHWAETEDGEAVDVTSFAITADKEFHAVWEAEPAGIKLFTNLGLNTTNFISAAKATDSVEINTIKYPYLVAFGSNRTSLAEAKQADLVMYSATTDATKIKFDLYNTNGSAKTAYVWLVEEGDDEATQLDAIEVAGTTRVKTAYYEFNGTKNRTVYLTSGAKTDIKVLQAKVIESGSAIHQFGQAGYVVDFNKGRIAGAADGTVSFEGAAITLKSDYKVLNSTSLSPKTYIQFNNPVANTIVKIKRSGSNKYYVTNDLGNKGTEYSSDQEITLTATGTWYIGSVNPGSAAQITKIEFVAPKCAEPQFNALANSDVCAGDGYVALDGTATVADAGVPTYKWYAEGADESDPAAVLATSATYTPTADGKYYVIAVNHLAGYTDNEKKSALVTVTTHAGTVITEPLVDLRGAKDAELALTVEATGKNLHYAWKESATIDGTYTDVAGATDNKTLNVTVTEGMDKYYKVVVSSDCGSDLESVAHVTQFVPVSQQDVTASIVWDWSEAASGNTDEMKNNTTPERDTEFIMANGDARIYNNANFCSDKLVISGQYAVRGGNYFQGGLVKFHTTVPGVVRVEFSHTATATAEKPARELFINGVGTGTIAASASHVRTAFIEVPAGDVSITAQYIDPTKPGNQYVRVYKVEFYTIAEQRTTGYAAGDLGTVCLEDATIIDGANLYKLAGLDQYGYLAFDEIQSGELEAGVPYLFEVTNPSMIGFYKQVNAAHSDDEIAHKGMIGTFSGTTLNQNVAENYYYFSGRHIWRVNDFTVGITIPAHRCYVDYDAVQAAGPAQAPAAGCRRVTLGVNGKNNATDVENLNASEAPVKLIIDGKMYILRGEKLFDATGRLVK